MVPEIGVMLGAYIVTRMVEMMLTVQGRPRIALTVLGIVTMLVTVVTIIDLVSRGTAVPGLQ